MILNSPGNPTGGVVERGLNVAIAGVLAEHSCWILSDEVYSELAHDAEHDTIARTRGSLDRTILVDGFSKTFAMTGWRLGYAALPEALVEPVTRLLINSVSCTPPAVQLAGLAALTGPRDEVDAMHAEFRRRRDAVVAGLNRLPSVTCTMPRGRVLRCSPTSAGRASREELAERLLDEAGVAVLSGTAFGAYGEGYLRLSYANTLENLEAALASIGDLLAGSAAAGAALPAMQALP